MANKTTGSVLRQMHSLFNVGTCAGLSDGQLLERFLARQGEAAELAFAVLLERHGPLVLRVCQRVLADPHEVDDAFQATFLVLVRRAGSIRERESVASWLHGVAFRVAACARAAAARRRRHEREGAKMTILARPGSMPEFDLRPLLDEEIGRLPEPFRAAVVLVDLEGLAFDQAARQLDWPLGTLKSRLARGRERLRGRLARRGLAPSLGALGALLARESASAASAVVPRALLDHTAKAAVRYAAGKYAAAGAVSAGAASLTEGVLKTMFLAKLKPVAIACGLLATSAGVWASAKSDDPPTAKDPSSPSAAPADDQRLGDLEKKVDGLLKLLADMKGPAGTRYGRASSSDADVIRAQDTPAPATTPGNPTPPGNFFTRQPQANPLAQQPDAPANNRFYRSSPVAGTPAAANQPAQNNRDPAHGGPFFAARAPLSWYFDLRSGDQPAQPGNPDVARFAQLAGSGPRYVPAELPPNAPDNLSALSNRIKDWTEHFDQLTPEKRSENFFKALEEITHLGAVRVSCAGDLEVSLRLSRPDSLERAKPILMQMLTQGPLQVTIEGHTGANYAPAYYRAPQWSSDAVFTRTPAQGVGSGQPRLPVQTGAGNVAPDMLLRSDQGKDAGQPFFNARKPRQNYNSADDYQTQKSAEPKPSTARFVDPALTDRVTKIEQQLDQLLKTLSDRKDASRP